MIITDFQQLEPFRYKTGIYLFTNKIEPDRHYGGKSVNLYKRIALEHKNGKDHSKQYIDRVIKKHGLLEYFTIELIHWWSEPVDDLEVLALETAVIDAYDCLVEKGGYNICLFGATKTGIPVSKATKRKISMTLTGRFRGKDSPRFGMPHSQETKEKLRKANTGKHLSEETRKKISLSRLGRKHTDATRQLMKEKRQGRDMSFGRKPVKQINKDTGEVIKIWESGDAAYKNIGLKSSSSISTVLTKKGKSAGGFYWEYA